MYRVAIGGLVIVGAAVGVGLLELYFRTVPWTPRTQVVRGYGLHTLDGVPVWGDESRANRACVERHPERLRVLFFGSSITYGSGVSADETFTASLEARLNEARPVPGFCILNLAQLGFQLQQKVAVARVEVPRYRPNLILWEHWVEWTEYRILGDAAYGISGYRQRPDGFVGVLGVPDGLNRYLFLHSQAYRFLALNHGQLVDLPAEEELMTTVTGRFMEVVRLAQSTGAKLVIYFAPPLDRPFEVTAASSTVSRQRMVEFSRAHGIPTYALENELKGEDYLQLRLDPCCHFNARGHRALVPVMTRIVMEQLTP